MNGRNLEQNAAAMTATRHLREFGFTGWHLRLRKGQRPANEAVTNDSERIERQVVQADQSAAESFAIGDDSTVFLMMGKPRPEPGDGLVALTRYWLIEDVSIMHSGGNDSIYALLCV